MSDKRQAKKRPALTPERALEQKERSDRLAEALRENLRKRKHQKREQLRTGDGGNKSGDTE